MNKKRKGHKKVNERDLLSKKLSIRFSSEDKMILTHIRRRDGGTYASIVRGAVYEKYAKDFGKR